MSQIFHMHITLCGSVSDDFPENYCTRIIAVRSHKSLQELAEAILNA